MPELQPEEHVTIVTDNGDSIEATVRLANAHEAVFDLGERIARNPFEYNRPVRTGPMSPLLPDRRVAARYPSWIRAAWRQPEAEIGPSEGFISDLSATGACIETQIDGVPGPIVVTFAWGNRKLTLDGICHHVVRTKDAAMTLHLELTPKLDADRERLEAVLVDLKDDFKMMQVMLANDRLGPQHRRAQSA